MHFFSYFKSLSIRPYLPPKVISKGLTCLIYYLDKLRSIMDPLELDRIFGTMGKHIFCFIFLFLLTFYNVNASLVWFMGNKDWASTLCILINVDPRFLFCGYIWSGLCLLYPKILINFHFFRSIFRNWSNPKIFFSNKRWPNPFRLKIFFTQPIWRPKKYDPNQTNNGSTKQFHFHEIKDVWKCSQKILKTSEFFSPT